MAANIDEFLETIARLRAPDGCPWDREQDHRSLARFVLEETYEVVEAIHSGSSSKLKEELGDLLLQIVLHAQIASEAGEFNFDDIAGTINEKMLARHPHVFGDAKADSAAAVVKQWEKLKQEEREKNGSEPKSLIDTVPNALPALLKALKVSEKAVGQGFEWRDFDELWDKVESEIKELRQAMAMPESPERTREVELELGDVLFTLVNVARWNKINPEESMLVAIDKFKQRWRMMEEITTQPLNELSKDELAELWAQAKSALVS